MCLLIGSSPIQGALANILRSFIVLPYKIDTAFFYGVYLLVIFLSIRKIVNRTSIDSIILIIFFLVLWLISFAINSQYDELYLKVGYDLFFTALPWYVMTRSVKDFSQLKKGLGITSLLITASIFISIFFLHNIDLEFSYSQSIAYLLLPAPIISASFIFEKINFVHLANLIISTVLIILIGARGPLTCIILFIVIKLVEIGRAHV